MNTRFFSLLIVALLTGSAAAEFPMDGTANPCVILETSAGDIKIELDEKRAPESVQNFLAYVKRGYYDGRIFHRVIPGFMIQGGGYDTDFEEGELDPPIANESRNGLSNMRGTVAMARTAIPNSATSQFFINLADNKRLDASEYRWGYAVFGKVVSGMDVVDAIAALPTGPAGPFMRDAPQATVLIKRAVLLNKAKVRQEK